MKWLLFALAKINITKYNFVLFSKHWKSNDMCMLNAFNMRWELTSTFFYCFKNFFINICRAIFSEKHCHCRPYIDDSMGIISMPVQFLYYRQFYLGPKVGSVMRICCCLVVLFFFSKLTSQLILLNSSSYIILIIQLENSLRPMNQEAHLKYHWLH